MEGEFCSIHTVLYHMVFIFNIFCTFKQHTAYNIQLLFNIFCIQF